MDRWSTLILSFLLVLTASRAQESKPCKIEGKECDCSNDKGMTRVFCVQEDFRSFPKLTTLPDNVIELDLSNNEIASLDLIEHVPTLEVLKLANNEITNLTSNTFENYGHLRVLDLSHNSLYKPKGAFFDKLEGLKVLNLSYNTFRKLPDNVFSNLISLKELVLRGNPLHMVRYELLESLETLMKLDLSATALDHLPNGIFLQLFRLECLDLSSNHFEEVPSNGLQSASGSLKHLNLGRNDIVVVKDGDFRRFSKLESLDLSDMGSLTTLDSGAFAGLTSLRVLTIKSNPNLKVLNFRVFDGLYSSMYHNWTLQELHLRDNGLERVEAPSTVLCHIPTLDLQDNPWNCDCNMRWIDNCPLRPELTSSLGCTQPENLNGKKIIDLNGDQYICLDDGLLKHQQRILRIVVIGSGIAGVFFCGLVIILVIKKRSIMEWWYYKKRGSGAVYYVKAQSNPKDNGDC